MDLPKYFELNGKYAVMLPKPDGSVRIIKDTGPAMADFMMYGQVITFKDLSKDFQQNINDKN